MCVCVHQVKCFHCTGLTRHLRADGTIAYINGDRTMTPAVNSQCGCGYRHYWDGGEYDNLPERYIEMVAVCIPCHSLSLSFLQNPSVPYLGQSHCPVHCPLVPTGVRSGTKLQCL